MNIEKDRQIEGRGKWTGEYEGRKTKCEERTVNSMEEEVKKGERWNEKERGGKGKEEEEIQKREAPGKGNSGGSEGGIMEEII